MPFIINLVILLVQTLGPALGAFFATTLGTTILISSIASLGSMLLSKLLPKPKLPSFSQSAGTLGSSLTVRQPISPRMLRYGTVRDGGVLFFLERSGANNELVDMGAVLSGRQLTAIDETWFADQLVTFDGSGNCTAPAKMVGFVFQEKHLGDPADTSQPFPELAARLPSKWGATDLLRGCGKVHLRIKLDQTVFPSGLPNPTFVMRGHAVLDTRTSTTAYSTNAALIARDYSVWDRNKGGLGLQASEFDDAYTNAAANVCDENVALAAGGTETRYTANGSISTDMDPRTALLGILSAMAGDQARVGGKWRMYAGAWRAATATIAEKDFRSDLSYSPLDSVANVFNAVKGVYVSPQNNYQASDFPPVTNPAYEADDGGRIWLDITLPFTNSPTRAQRIAKIKLEDGRRQGTGTFPLKLTALNVTVLDTLAVNFADFGWSGKTFRITASAFAADNAGSKRFVYGVNLDVKETDANVYAWSTANEVAPQANSSNTIGDLSSVQPATGVAVAPDDPGLIAADGTASPRLLVSWTAPADQLVKAGGKILLAYKRSADSTYINLPPVDGAATSAYIDGVSAGQKYDVQVTAQNLRGARSATVTVAGTLATVSSPMLSGDIAVANGNFEGSAQLPPPGWQANNANAALAYETGSPQSGSRSLKVVATAQYAGALSIAKWKVAPGEIYRITGWMKSDSSKIADLQFGFYDSGGGYLSGAFATNTSGSWTFFSATATAPANSVSGQVSLTCDSVAGGTVYFDNVMVRKVVQDGDATFNNSTHVNPQGSIPPQGLPSWSFSSTYDGGSATSNAVWTIAAAYSLPRGDGSTIVITSGSQSWTWTNLTPGGSYVWGPYWDTGSQAFIARGAGVHWAGGGTPSPAASDLDPNSTPLLSSSGSKLNCGLNRQVDGRIPLSEGLLAGTLATAGGGGSGGGGDPSCVEADEITEILDPEGDPMTATAKRVRLADVRVGDYVRGRNLKTGAIAWRPVDWKLDEFCSQWRRVPYGKLGALSSKLEAKSKSKNEDGQDSLGALVTPMEPVWVAEEKRYRYAYELASTMVEKRSRKVYLHVVAPEDDEHNFAVLGVDRATGEELGELIVHNPLNLS